MGLEVKPSEIRACLIENGIDPDLIREYLEEQLEMSRSTDLAMRSIMDANEFWKRETKYTQIQKFIIHIK